MRIHTEASSQDNHGIRDIINILYEMQCIECSNKNINDKYFLAEPMIKKVTKLLYKKQNFVTFRPMWENLHDRMVYYYDYLNKKNISSINRSEYKIPIFRETLHNEAVKWWLKCKRYGIIQGPLIHFDTHDDMGAPTNPKQLMDENGKLKHINIEKGACGKIYWPVTCMLLSKGVNHVIWALPKWVYDDNASYDQVLVWHKTNGIYYIRPDGQKKDNFLLESDIIIAKNNELEDSKKYKFFHPIHLDRFHVDNTATWKKMISMINDTKFILDIDLDFFVSNGDNCTKKSYVQNFDDLESHYRVHDFPGIRTPRNMHTDSYSQEVIHELNKEMKIIEKRIKSFMNGLKLLKSNGIIPCCISISDSTTSFFSGNSERAVITNQYTPKYFVPILYEMLLKGFEKLYGKIL